MVQLKVDLQAANKTKTTSFSSAPSGPNKQFAKPPFPPIRMTAAAVTERVSKSRERSALSGGSGKSVAGAMSGGCNDVTLTSNDAAWFVESWIVEYAIAYQHMSVVDKVIQYRRQKLQEELGSESCMDLEVAALEQCNLHSTFILFHLVNRAVFSLQPLPPQPLPPVAHSSYKGLYTRASNSLETLLSRFSGQIRSRAIVYIHVLCIQELIHENELGDEQLKKLIVKILQPESKSNCDVICKVRDNCVAVVQSRSREGGERARGMDKIVQLILEGDRAQGDVFNGRAELLNQWAKSMRNIREKIGTTILERMNVFGLNTVLGFVPQLRDLPVVQHIATHISNSAPDQEMRISAECLNSFLDLLYSNNNVFTQPPTSPHTSTSAIQSLTQNEEVSQAICGDKEQQQQGGGTEKSQDEKGEQCTRATRETSSETTAGADGSHQATQAEKTGGLSNASSAVVAPPPIGGLSSTEQEEEAAIEGSARVSKEAEAVLKVGAAMSLQQFSQQHHLRLDIVTEDDVVPPHSRRRSSTAPNDQQQKVNAETPVQGGEFIPSTRGRSNLHFRVSSPSSSEEAAFASECSYSSDTTARDNGKKGNAQNGATRSRQVLSTKVKYLRLTDDQFKKDYGRVCLQLNSEGLKLLGLNPTDDLIQSVLLQDTCNCACMKSHHPSHESGQERRERERDEEAQRQREEKLVKDLEEAQKLIVTALQTVTPSKHSPSLDDSATNHAMVSTGSGKSRKRKTKGPQSLAGDFVTLKEQVGDLKKQKRSQEVKEKKMTVTDESGADSEETQRAERDEMMVVRIDGEDSNEPATPVKSATANCAFVEQLFPVCQDNAKPSETQIAGNSASGVSVCSKKKQEGFTGELEDASPDKDIAASENVEDWWPLLCGGAAQQEEAKLSSEQNKTKEADVCEKNADDNQMLFCGAESPTIDIESLNMSPAPLPAASVDLSGHGKAVEELEGAAHKLVDRGLQSPSSTSSESQENKQPPASVSDKQPQQTGNSSLVYIRPKHEMMARMLKTQQLSDDKSIAVSNHGKEQQLEKHVLRSSNAVLNSEQHSCLSPPATKRSRSKSASSQADAVDSPPVEVATQPPETRRRVNTGASGKLRSSKGRQGSGGVATGKKYKLANAGNTMSKLLFDLNDKRLSKKKSPSKVMFHPLSKPLRSASKVHSVGAEESGDVSRESGIVNEQIDTKAVESTSGASILSTICFDTQLGASDLGKCPSSESTVANVESTPTRAYEEDSRQRMELSDISCFLAPSDEEPVKDGEESTSLLDDSTCSFNASFPATSGTDNKLQTLLTQEQVERSLKKGNKSCARKKGKKKSKDSGSSWTGPRTMEEVGILGCSGFRIALPVLYFPKGQLSMDYSEWRLKQEQFERTLANSETPKHCSKRDTSYHVSGGFSVQSPPSFCSTESLTAKAAASSPPCCSSDVSVALPSSSGDSFHTCQNGSSSSSGSISESKALQVSGEEQETLLNPLQDEVSSLSSCHCDTAQHVQDCLHRKGCSTVEAEDNVKTTIKLPSPMRSMDACYSPSPCRSGTSADFLASEDTTSFSKKCALVFIRPKNNQLDN